MPTKKTGLRKRVSAAPRKVTEMDKAVRMMNKFVEDLPKNLQKALVKKMQGGTTTVKKPMRRMKKGGKA